MFLHPYSETKVVSLKMPAKYYGRDALRRAWIRESMSPYTDGSAAVQLTHVDEFLRYLRDSCLIAIEPKPSNVDVFTIEQFLGSKLVLGKINGKTARNMFASVYHWGIRHRIFDGSPAFTSEVDVMIDRLNLLASEHNEHRAKVFLHADIADPLFTDKQRDRLILWLTLGWRDQTMKMLDDDDFEFFEKTFPDGSTIKFFKALRVKDKNPVLHTGKVVTFNCSCLQPWRKHAQHALGCVACGTAWPELPIEDTELDYFLQEAEATRHSFRRTAAVILRIELGIHGVSYNDKKVQKAIGDSFGWSSQQFLSYSMDYKDYNIDTLPRISIIKAIGLDSY